MRVEPREAGSFIASGNRIDLLECPSCHEPALVRSRYWGESPDGEEVWVEPVQLYPPLPQAVSAAVPERLRASFGEAVACFRCGTFTACAIMCRKAMEGLCVEKNIKAGNLAAGLKKLKDEGVVDERLYRWADMLRVAGNEAAHDVNVTANKEDARDILDFTRALLEYVFTFEQRFEEFVARRTRRDAKAAGTKEQPPT